MFDPIDYDTDDLPTFNDLADDVDLDSDGPDICPDCNGSGEGQNEHARCWNCKGKGTV